MQNTTYWPPIDTTREVVSLPITHVTLLEDRAQITRRTTLTQTAGRHRWAILNVAPVLQDVSLRATITHEGAHAVDVRIRRAMQVRDAEKPEAIAALDTKIKALANDFSDARERTLRATQRVHKLKHMLAESAAELTEDVAWGQADIDAWNTLFSTLCARMGDQARAALEAHFQQRDLQAEHTLTWQQRQLLDSPEHTLTAWLELDVVVTQADTPFEIEVHYTVPNALWRPIHQARLQDDILHFTSSAAVWQNTGEDWRGVELDASTARSSLGTDPPTLSSDLLSVKRRSEDVTVSTREVSIQRAGVAAAEAPSTNIELPGVDDGGDVLNLRAQNPVDLDSDGQPGFFPLFNFQVPTKVESVAIPEHSARVYTKSTQLNAGTSPILAGPVELIRDNGPVGWTQTLFVARNEAFELGWGPDDTIRLVREHRVTMDKVDDVDKWHRKRTAVRLWFSHLSEGDRRIHLVERVPVSEIEHVRVSVLSEGVEADSDGFCHHVIELGTHERCFFEFEWELATAPGVKHQEKKSRWEREDF